MSANLKYKQEIEKEKAASDFIPYSCLVNENIVKLHNGDLVSTIKVNGVSFESSDAIDINGWHDQICNMLRNIASPDMALWSHIVRRKYNAFPGGEFKEGFCNDLNEKYKASITSGEMLINELYISIVIRKDTNELSTFFSRLENKNKASAIESQNEAIEKMNDAIGNILSSMDAFSPELLGCYRFNGFVFSEQLEFYHYLLNGEHRRMPLPRNDISKILVSNRTLFGKGGIAAIRNISGTQYFSVIGLQEYPTPTYPGILNGLINQPFEFVLSQSFTFLSKQVAVRKMKRQQGRMVNSGDLSETQIKSIDDALDDLTANKFVMGVHSFSLIIRSDDKKVLNNSVEAAGVEISNSGAKWAREDLAAGAAYFAQLPGNFKFRINVADVSSRNFAGFSCFHNYPLGRIAGNQWGDCVTMFKTSSAAPYYFNFHASEVSNKISNAVIKIDKDHFDPASTLIIGKTGTGKTVLEAFLLAQLQKYQSKGRITSVIFDKDQSVGPIVRGLNGKYYTLKNGVKSGFNPLQLEPTPANISFVESLIKQLVKFEGLPLTPKEDRAISGAISGVFKAPKDKRRLSSVKEFLLGSDTSDNGIGTRLAKWCEGGANAWLFDNLEDTLDINAPLVGFDVTEFLENKETRTPTMMYLLHRVHGLLDGRKCPIFMEEFGLLMNDEAFAEFSEKGIVTFRKKDAFLVMITQDPQQALRSKFAYALINQTSTKIFLPNPTANKEDYINGFKLTQQEYELIRGFGEKSRRFLIKQGHNSVVAELNLKGFDDELAVLSGNANTSKLAEKLVSELGDDPNVWLPEFLRLRKEYE